MYIVRGGKDMRLEADEIRIILAALQEKYGLGYADDLNVSQLQAKLSIMLEVAVKMEGAL